MHQRSSPTARSFPAGQRLRPWCALTILLLGASSAFAQAPDRAEDHDPLFQPFLVNPYGFAALTVGGGANPSVGAFQAYDMLLAGEHPFIGTWTFYEPTLSPRQNTSAAATALLGLAVTGRTAPLGELALVLGGEKSGCWRLKNPELVQPLPTYLLKEIRDGRLVSSKVGNGREFEAFVETVILANDTTTAAFQRAARRDVGFSNLFNAPNDYRGQVVHVEGRLRLLQKDEAPAMLRLAGVQDLYFAWVFDDLSGNNPYCVVLTEPPANIAVNQKINQRVTFDGYFYMNRKYKAEDSKKPTEFRIAPLLIGHTLAIPPVETAAPADKTSAWSTGMLTGFLALAAAVMILMGGVGYWFRWNDARVRRRLTATRRYVEAEPTDEAVPEWPA